MNKYQHYKPLSPYILFALVIFSTLYLPFAGFEMVFAQIEVIDTVAVESGPRGVAYNADNGFMYMTNTFSDTVSIIGIIVPIADAGPDQSVDSGATVQLDGTGSSTNGGSPIASYQWTQTQGPTVTLDDPTSATPSFTAPETPVEENIRSLA